ncbi:NADPH-dependent FMN reductase [Vagococcus silagei]|uniref:NAD(P)H-dependent oxidoreductase n=1 Tax=Vagococcus silagei TaxID=2508885 RepID=A0A4S3B335_9ENTE|nr:NADPH-dependent FMN reductase [Vagococcus silagei]THB60150.1 NAD(P)H-dependent oxidoreductase [Vagococcus silagei]
MKKIIGLVGTNSKKSTNRQLLEFIQKHFADQFEMELVEIKYFPIFNKPDSNAVPGFVQEISAKIEESDGVIISTPEYNHAVPAVLMNALAWLSYHNYPFVDKPVMITGASYGTLGSSRAQAHLRHILDAPEMKARIMPSSEFLLSNSLQAFDENDDLNQLDQVARLEELVADFMTFIDIMSQLNHGKKTHKEDAAKFSWEKL